MVGFFYAYFTLQNNAQKSHAIFSIYIIDKVVQKCGSIGRGANSPTAIASVAYDVLNQRVLDAQFGPMSMDERSLDKEMFRMCYFLRCPVEENYKLIKGNAGLTPGEVCPFLSTLDSFLWSAQSAVCYFACISFKHPKLLTLLINDKINPALCFAG